MSGKTEMTKEPRNDHTLISKIFFLFQKKVILLGTLQLRES